MPLPCAASLSETGGRLASAVVPSLVVLHCPETRFARAFVTFRVYRSARPSTWVLAGSNIYLGKAKSRRQQAISRARRP